MLLPALIGLRLRTGFDDGEEMQPCFDRSFGSSLGRSLIHGPAATGGKPHDIAL